MRPIPKKITLKNKTLPSVGLVIVGLFAIAGIIALSQSSAATSMLTAELENGSVNGNAAIKNGEVNASGASAVLFGSSTSGPAPTLPTKLRAYTGGDSVGVVWTPGSFNGSWVQNYNVFRNGVKVATTQPDATNDPMRNGSQYIDKNISAGQTYTYQVQAVAPDGKTSAMTASYNVTVPTSSPAVPNVVVDSSLASNIPQLANWINSVGVPNIKTWYPKISSVFVKGGYAPPNTIYIKGLSDADFTSKYGSTAVAVTIGDTMIMDGGYFSDPQTTHYASSTLVHESVHIMQYYTNGTFQGPTSRWFVEGMAEYATYEIAGSWPFGDGLEYYTAADSYYYDRYLPSANFLRWIDTQKTANYTLNSNVASYNGSYNADFMRIYGDSNPDQAWSTFRNQPTRTGNFTNRASGKCMDDSGANINRGTITILYQCTGNYAQRITYRVKPGGSAATLTVLGHCIATANGGTANGTYVWIDYCDKSSAAQEWVKQSDGSIVNPASGRCLEVNGGNVSNNDGQRLGLWDCNGGAWQQWDTP